MSKLFYLSLFLFLKTSIYSQSLLQVSFEFINFGEYNNDHTKKYQSIVSNEKEFYAGIDFHDAHPTKKDSNGVILKYKDIAKLTEAVLFSKNTKLNSPKGMCVLKNTLFVADIDRIVGFDLKTGNKVSEINLFRYSTNLYDLKAIDDSTMIFSAMDKGCLFKLNPKSGNICQLGLPNLPGASAMYYENDDSLYVCSVGNNKTKGQIWNIAITTENYKIIKKDLGRCYGINKFNNYLIYVIWDEESDIHNLYTLPITAQKSSSWEIPEKQWNKNWWLTPHLKQPGIFILSKRSKHIGDLFIPDNKNGAVYTVNLEETK